MPQRAGNRLGPYEIVALLGTGGMGEVYRARDTRLDREVAIKVLPDDLSESSAQRRRLAREARAISSLQHPNICALHDVGSENGVDYLVMELLEGETLAERLLRGALPLRELFPIAIALADALDKAHRKGLVHRDLKPGNVMLTPAGPKILDFGLARSAIEGVDLEAATATVGLGPVTAEGTLIGTYHYMSPEQLEGREADARSDLFAFGAMLYEMASGRRAFAGQTVASVIAAVLERQPVSLVELEPAAPAELDRVVRICLAKDPSERFQSAHDLKLELERIRDTSVHAPPARTAHSRQGWRERLAWSLAAALGLASLFLGLGSGRHVEPEPVRLHADLLPPSEVAFSKSPQRLGPAVLSPDGRELAWVAVAPSGETLLWVRQLERGTTRELPNTVGASFPFWSPDGRALGYFFANARGRRAGRNDAATALERIDLSTGVTTRICDARDGRGGTWNQDGVILFAPTGQSSLLRVEANGGVPTAVTELDTARHEVGHLQPRFLPDGEHFVFLDRRGAEEGGPETIEIWLGSLTGGAIRRLTNASSQAEYAQGHLLFASGAELVAQPFDEERLELHGSPLPVASPLLVSPGEGAAFSVSRRGMLAYQPEEETLRTIAWYSRRGVLLEKFGEAGPHTGVALAPGSQRAAFVTVDGPKPNHNVWLLDLAQGGRERLTSDPLGEWMPVWSPDGRSVFFCREGTIMVKEVGTRTPETLVFNAAARTCAMSIAPDGRMLAIAPRQTQEVSDLMLLPLDRSGEPVPIAATEHFEFGARFSPDGRWIAYESDESGRMEVYAQPILEAALRRQISRDGGSDARWRGDSRELFFLDPEGRTMVAALEEKNGAVTAADVEVLFEFPRASRVWGYDVAPDGDRFLILAEDMAAREPIRLVLNWVAGLR